MSSNTTSPTITQSSVVPSSTPLSSPASSAASTTDPKTNFKKPIAAIVGGVGGGIVIIGALLGICLVRKARKKPSEPIFSPMIRLGSSPTGLMQHSPLSLAMTTNLTGSTGYHTGNTSNSMPQRFPTSAEIWLRPNITTIFCDVGFMHWVVPLDYFAEYCRSCIVIIWNFQTPLSGRFWRMRKQGGGIKWTRVIFITV